MSKYDCKCSHTTTDHRLEADDDGPVGSCKLCDCPQYQRAEPRYFPRFAQ